MYELKMTLKSLLQETQETQEKAQQNAGARTRGTQFTCFTSTKVALLVQKYKKMLTLKALLAG
jgi:hypothetical protein